MGNEIKIILHYSNNSIKFWKWKTYGVEKSFYISKHTESLLCPVSFSFFEILGQKRTCWYWPVGIELVGVNINLKLFWWRFKIIVNFFLFRFWQYYYWNSNFSPYYRLIETELFKKFVLVNITGFTTFWAFSPKNFVDRLLLSK